MNNRWSVPVSRPFKKNRHTGRKPLSPIVVIATVFSAVLALALFSIAIGGWVRDAQRSVGGERLSKQAILALWQDSDWKAVISACDQALLASPLEPFHLGMRGLASFYEAMDLPEGGERSVLNSAAIVYLRKALATKEAMDPGRLPRAQLEYVLAKAYFHGGNSTLDLSAKYMESALAQGFGFSDGYEYLAMAYASLGDIQKSLAAFEKAMSQGRDALLEIAAAREYLAAGKDVEAERLLLDAAASGTDAVAREKARLLLAGHYFETSRWDQSESQVNALLAENPDSAEAHFRLGLIFQVRGDQVHARAEWRKAVTLDPMHAAARQKLSERY